MKKILILKFLLILSVVSFSQEFCLPVIGGKVASDEPPGCLICSEKYFGSTQGFTADTFAQNLSCGDIENNQWLSVQADFEGKINLSFETENCINLKGIQVALFDQGLNLEQCFTIPSTRNMSAQNLFPGGVYWLMIDGKDGDICDFTITRTVPKNLVTWRSSNAGRRRVCPGGEVCFNIGLGFPAGQYQWEIDTSAITILSGGGLLDSFVCVRFDSVITTDISVNPIAFCNADHFTSKQFEVVDRPVFLQRKTHALCLPDVPFTEFGQEIDSFGFTRIVYKTAGGCDSVYEFSVNRFQIETEKSAVFCEGDTVFHNGIPLTEGGTHEFFHEFGDQNQCDSLFSYHLTQIDTAAPEITCLIDTFIRAVGLKWKDNPFVIQYDLTINDSLIVLGNRNTYLHLPKVPNEVLDISLKAYSPNCMHHISRMKCIGPEKVSSVENSLNDQAIIFPNPSTGLFEIMTPSRILETEVFDFSGRRILKTDASKIDLSKEPSGVYIFKIRGKEGISIEKVIKS